VPVDPPEPPTTVIPHRPPPPAPAPLPPVPHAQPEVGTAALLNDPAIAGALDGQLKKGQSLDKILARLKGAQGHTKQKVGRLVEHLRLLYQLKIQVQLENFKQKKRLNQAQLNKWVVSTYKLIGFSVLTLIVLGLVSYLASNLFYWWSTSWIEPTVIAATDEHVMQLSTKLAEVASTRDKLAADLQDADRVIAMQQEFLANAQQALSDELSDRQNELRRLAELNRRYASTRAQIHNASHLYTGMSRRRLAAEYDARLIDRSGAVTGAFQLSQIAQGDLSLDEKGVELDKRTAELTRDTQALSALKAQTPAGGKRSFEVLRILADLKRAQVELAKAVDSRKVLAASLARYEKMVKDLQDSPYLRAVEKKATIAFVPYENLDHVKAGTPLYSCWTGLFFCHKAGTVVDVLSGEMTVKHPLHNQMMRGQSVQVQLTDPRAAERNVLFAGGRPILF
jgi:hypothetical protein